MKFSIAVVSHRKRLFLPQALLSIQAQGEESWHAIILDSGQLFEGRCFDKFHDQRFSFLPTGEAPDLNDRLNAGAHAFNRILNSGLLIGELLMLMCDDDTLYPHAFQVFWKAYEAKDRPALWAGYGHQQTGRSDERGITEFGSCRMADVPRGKSAGGAALDCVVDQLQVCFTSKLLDEYRKRFGPEILSERLEDKAHADGIFLEKLGEIVPIEPVMNFVSVNRRTPLSVYTGG